MFSLKLIALMNEHKTTFIKCAPYKKKSVLGANALHVEMGKLNPQNIAILHNFADQIAQDVNLDLRIKLAPKYQDFAQTR